MVFCQDEGAFAGQWLGQGTQVLFLDEVAVDDVGFGQLIAELLQIKSVGQPWNAQ
ncbi:hypothetical protein D3C86_1960080 [compost metagenome]